MGSRLGLRTSRHTGGAPSLTCGTTCQGSAVRVYLVRERTYGVRGEDSGGARRVTPGERGRLCGERA